MPGCQTRWQWNGLANNRNYRKNSYSCNETDHHSHWYCKICYHCANPYGNYTSPPNENTLCKCNEEYQEFSDYILEESYSQMEQEQNDNIEEYSDQYSNSSNLELQNDDIESILDGKGKDWRQDLHDIHLQVAEFKQVTVKQMKNRSLKEVHQEYSASCTLCGKIITENLDHNCVIGYGLGQIHPEMISEALTNDVFWEIPEKVQRADEACKAALALLQPDNNPETLDSELEEYFNLSIPSITIIHPTSRIVSRTPSPDFY